MGIDLKLQTKVLRIQADSVSIETGTGIESVPADTVVIATGSRPVNDLSQRPTRPGIETVTIGDAKEPRKIGDAIREGFDAAMQV